MPLSTKLWPPSHSSYHYLRSQLLISFFLFFFFKESSFSKIIIYLFITMLHLCCCEWARSICGMWRVHSVVDMSFSSHWLLFLWPVGSRAHRLSSCSAQGLLLCSMWDPPGPGIELVSHAVAGRFLTTGPLAKFPNC